MKPWKVCIPEVADSHNFDEEQDPDPHLSEKSDPDPRYSEKMDPHLITTKTSTLLTFLFILHGRVHCTIHTVI
jgi:hypothetical protein